MRIYWTLGALMAGLLAGLPVLPLPPHDGGCRPVWAADEAEPQEPPADQPADAPPDAPADVAEEDPGDDTSGGDAPAEETNDPPPSIPEGVKRLPPGTAEEEREYKKRKTREDPFLTSPPPSRQDAFYDPADWLRRDVAFGSSRYMVQDASGKVLGNLTLDIRAEKHPVEGELIHLTETSNYGQQQTLEAWVYADSFRPKRAVLSKSGGPDSADMRASRIVADYLFDRLTVSEDMGAVSSRKQLRLLPFTFDSAETLLLIRQLQFVRGDWPFEAGLLDFASGDLMPLLVSTPLIKDCIAADGVSYGCFELSAMIGSEKLRFWVERANPHRLVKFERGALVFTLQDYRAASKAAV
jgi:hypothetical protein